jgi:hypothetical protein
MMFSGQIQRTILTTAAGKDLFNEYSWFPLYLEHDAPHMTKFRLPAQKLLCEKSTTWAMTCREDRFL